MKHCNLPFTKCYPLFCILSNFDTSGGEYLQQFVQYSCIVHFKTSFKIQSVNILCHRHTRHLIIKIWNDNQQKFWTWYSGIVNWGKKVNTVYAWKVGDPAEVHTLLTPFKSPIQETQPLVQPTAAAFDKVQVQRIHGQFDHDKFYNKL